MATHIGINSAAIVRAAPRARSDRDFTYTPWAGDLRHGSGNGIAALASDGDDIITVGLGNFTATGGLGTDRLIVDYAAASSQVYLIVPLSADPAGGFQGSYYISGGFARVDFTSIENFTVTSGIHADVLVTGNGDDVVTSGDGNDRITVGRGNDVVDAGLGADALSIDLSDEAVGVTIDLSRTGQQQTSGTGSIRGLESFAGTVTGSALADTMIEKGKFDTNAVFSMGNGNDVVGVSDGNDIVNGEAGNDRLIVDYTAAESFVYMLAPLLDDAAGGFKGSYYISGGFARADFTGIENFTVTTGVYNDVLVTGSGNDVVNSGDGADVLTVGRGNDNVDAGAGNDALSIDLSDETVGVTIDLARTDEQQTGGTGSIRGIESFAGTVTGSAFADTMLETGKFNTNATFNMGNGNDVVGVSDGNDVINGEAGNDRLIVDYTAAESFVYMLAPFADDTAGGFKGSYYINGGFARADFTGIENFTVTTGIYNDILVTGSGNDVVTSGDGNDVLTVGRGTDTVDAGAGNDALSIDLSDETVGVTIDLSRAGQQQTSGTGSIRGVESFAGAVTGSASADTVIEKGQFNTNAVFSMGNGNDVVGVSDGNDIVNGEAGNDRLIVDYAAAESFVYMLQPFVEDTAGGFKGSYYINGGFARADFTGVENFTVTSGDFNDILVTGSGDDNVTTGLGNDRVTIGRGKDNVDGGAGIDALSIDLSDDTSAVAIDLRLTGAQLSGGTGTITGFESFVGTFTGSAKGDTLFEGRYDFNAVFNTGDGNDTIGVSDGYDIINGGAGTDRLIVDYSTAESTVYMLAPVVADPNGGFQGSYYIAGGFARADFTGIETFTITGGTFNDTLVTGDGGDIVSGGDGNDTITAGGGNDLLSGGLGNDTLAGGDGNDTATYEAATVAVTVSLKSAGAQDTGGAGTDTLTGIENLVGSAFADRLSAGGGANTLTGGAGDDRLNGGGGKDVLIGGADKDQLTGGIAADTFVFDLASGKDTIGDFTQLDGDRIRIDAAGVVFEDLTITADGAGGTRVKLDALTITLTGVDPALLTEADFIFGTPGAAPAEALSPGALFAGAQAEMPFWSPGMAFAGFDPVAMDLV